MHIQNQEEYLEISNLLNQIKNQFRDTELGKYYFALKEEKLNYEKSLPYFNDPILFIKTKMKIENLTISDLHNMKLGDKKYLSSFLNKKRKMPLDLIRKFHDFFDWPLEILVKDYTIDNEK